MGPQAPPTTAFAPGRVNLVGDHTDYAGGVALPMTVQMGVTAYFHAMEGDAVEVVSEGFGRARLGLGGTDAAPADGAAGEGDTPEQPWARLVGAVVQLARPERGGSLRLRSSLPAGAGLSSSAALCVAVARVLGVDAEPLAVAVLCREAEHRAGSPVGLMDPWVCAGGRAGHAMLLDFTAATATPVPLPDEAEWVVVESGQRRSLAGSDYAARVAECEAAAAVVGPLARATPADLAGIRDPVLRRRARHVVTECERVRSTAQSLASGDLVAAGRDMDESHRSLAEDFEVSSQVLDQLVAELRGRPGVLGARLTGAGFGGCVVALCRREALDIGSLAGLVEPGGPAVGASPDERVAVADGGGGVRRAWRVRPVDGTYARGPG